MSRIIEWIGSIMFMVAIIEFVPHPKKALESIMGTLSSNVRIEHNHLVLKRTPSRVSKVDHARE